MKKKIIIGIILIVLVALIGFGIYKYIKHSDNSYEIAKVEDYNYFVLKTDNLSGVMDKTGEIIVEAKYDEVKIPNPEEAVFICYTEDKTRVLNENNEEILTEFQNVEPVALKNISSDLMYEKTILTYVENEKYGLIEFDGKIVKKAEYDYIEGMQYKEGELLVKSGEKFGVINIRGKAVVNTEFDEVILDGYYTNENQYKYAGYIVANKTEEGYRYGYINYKGKLIEKENYNELERIVQIEENDSIYLVCAENGQKGMRKNGKSIIPNEYQSITYEEENGILIIEKSGKFGVCNIEGNILIPVEYKQIDVTGMYLYAQNDQGTTVYDSEGKEVSISSNISILNTVNENYKIKINNENGTKYGVINKNEKSIIGEKYNYIEYLFDNYFIASNENGKLGILNDKEEIKVEFNYDSLQKIEETDVLKAVISEKKLTQIYSKNLEKMCEMENAIVDKKDEYIEIYNDIETKYYDMQGKELSTSEVYKNNNLLSQVKDNKWGFVNRSAELVVEYKYDRVTEFNEYGFASVQMDGKWGVIGIDGQEIIVPTYEFQNQKKPQFIGKYYKVIFGFGEFYYTDKI